MYIYSEAYEERQQEEKALLKKWEKALNAEGGVKDEYMARNTAILLENYLQHLQNDPRLIAEDQVQSNAFTGVNLALLGLIARVIPNLVGSELVGIQSMPTPKSPIFTIKWEKDHNKGYTQSGDEMWITPVDHEVGLDPHYSSQRVNEPVEKDEFTSGYVLGWANENDNLKNSKPFIFPNSIYITGYDADGEVIADYLMEGDYSTNITGQTPIDTGFETSGDAAITFNWTASTRTLTASAAIDQGAGDHVIDKIIVSYEYKGEGEPNIPEISFSISEETVDLIRRQLRGKFTMDAAYDLKKLHGINLDSELTNMMKVELQAEINREIISDLRMLAGITKTLDYTDFRGSTTGISTTGNYDDSHRVLLDAITVLAAEIYNQGRLGRGNWVVGNPTTLAFLDRVPGFVGSGVSYNGKELSYAGSLGGKMKFYIDPNFPKDELLIGYKGPGALDTGYVHAPYLPITATPTIINQETGDPSKIFYTRYGKTFTVDGGTTNNLVLNGQYQYARLLLTGMPSPISI